MGEPAQRKTDLNNLGAAIAGVTDNKVKVNGKLLSTDGSSVQDHLLVNNKPIARIGDSCDAGAITGGSSNVFAG